MTHKQQMDKVKPAVPCAAWHVTFGGRCLNCGYDPEVKSEKERSAAKFRARVAAKSEQRNTDGRTFKGQRALERAARLTYEYDRDFEYETPE